MCYPTDVCFGFFFFLSFFSTLSSITKFRPGNGTLALCLPLPPPSHPTTTTQLSLSNSPCCQHLPLNPPPPPQPSHTSEPSCVFAHTDAGDDVGAEMVLVAIRGLSAGDAITIDYATASASHTPFACTCGSSGCRSEIKADDWRLPALQDRYVFIHLATPSQRHPARLCRSGSLPADLLLGSACRTLICSRTSFYLHTLAAQ